MNKVACDVCGKLGDGTGWIRARMEAEGGTYYEYSDLEPGWAVTRARTKWARPVCPEHQEAKP